MTIVPLDAKAARIRASLDDEVVRLAESLSAIDDVLSDAVAAIEQEGRVLARVGAAADLLAGVFAGRDVPWAHPADTAIAGLVTFAGNGPGTATEPMETFGGSRYVASVAPEAAKMGTVAGALAHVRASSVGRVLAAPMFPARMFPASSAPGATADSGSVPRRMASGPAVATIAPVRGGIVR